MWRVCSSAFCVGMFYIEDDTDDHNPTLRYADREIPAIDMPKFTSGDTDKYFTLAQAEIVCDQLNVRDYGRVGD